MGTSFSGKGACQKPQQSNNDCSSWPERTLITWSQTFSLTTLPCTWLIEKHVVIIAGMLQPGQLLCWIRSSPDIVPGSRQGFFFPQPGGQVSRRLLNASQWLCSPHSKGKWTCWSLQSAWDLSQVLDLLPSWKGRKRSFHCAAPSLHSFCCSSKRSSGEGPGPDHRDWILECITMGSIAPAGDLPPAGKHKPSETAHTRACTALNISKAAKHLSQTWEVANLYSATVCTTQWST